MLKAGIQTTIFIFALLFILSGSAAFAGEPRTVEVMNNVYTIVDGDGVDSNTTFITTKEGVIVIDTRPTPAEARKVLAEIRKRTDLPIVYTINTHYHGGHTFGNQVFKDSKTIIAHKNVRNMLIDFGQDNLSSLKTLKIPGMDEVEITLPNVVFEKRMKIWLGEYRLELLYDGRGHTNGDTIIYIDHLRTIIAGDLISNGEIPYMGDAYLDEWIETLNLLEQLKNETVIPGHGPIGGRPTIIAMKHYLLSLKGLVLKQLDNSKSLKAAQEAVAPVLREKYKSWKKLERIEGNIERAWLEYSAKEGT